MLPQPRVARATLRATFFAFVLSLCVPSPAAPTKDWSAPADAEGSALLLSAHRQIAAYHDGHALPEAERPRLRVVYFHPSDREPLADYAARLDRILTDISEFYRDGLRRFGLPCDGLPLERKEGRLVIHLVRGKKPASDYTYESGNVTKAEVREALKGTVDLDREYVLILYGLFHKDDKGRHVFNAPYYGDGWSDQDHGLCHAADGEWLDVPLLSDSQRSLTFIEHYYLNGLTMSVATFNSWYIGGIAHELGHGLGLPHDAGQAAEASFGTSLMGTGNRHYRNHRWGGSAPAYLSRTTALQLLSHPLVTGSNRDRREWPELAFDEVAFATRGQTLQIAGRTAGKIPTYAVAAYVIAKRAGSDHAAQTFTAKVDTGGRFDLSVAGLRPDTYRLRLQSMHVNGATTQQELELAIDSSRRPDIPDLQAQWSVVRAKRAIFAGDPEARRFLVDPDLASDKTGQTRRGLAVLQAVVTPPVPVELDRVTASRVYLSDAAWLEARVGWGEPRRNTFWFSDSFNRGIFLFLKDRLYDKGLYAHADSSYVFATGGKWKAFAATVGLRDGALKQGSAIFTVLGDGREVYRSPLLRPRESAEVTVDITGVKRLELVAKGGEGHTSNAWAVWLDPLVSR